MNKFLISTIALLIFITAQSQNSTDSITIVRSNNISFIQNNIVLTPKRLAGVLKSNTTSYKELRAAKNNLFFSDLFSYAGGFMIGAPLGTVLAGGKPEWALAAAGVGLVVVSIPLRLAYSRRTINAVNIYNTDLKKNGCLQKEVHLAATSNGFGLVMKF
ncbi:MAG: hypothetical protein A2W93_03815 [Bacteroidetes bacterium GWF2_43_63]|nr:MAG: hypothetical protein A2W94_15885 [Bacteroidetes bacterium GWE2_42_42]OFY55352.1 MAG: hypothetical protein A2W93_03815 [Bacteroidetes bacterium GWF2_43_63]HBG71882.1 hypothetical protein [Bacteroidales bacterium]HCB61776.1 hypothetical protein [Bacteroidales bacterium]HCY22628.1 hypothetical protein [Bacteroidales bacterium]